MLKTTPKVDAAIRRYMRDQAGKLPTVRGAGLIREPTLVELAERYPSVRYAGAKP